MSPVRLLSAFLLASMMTVLAALGVVHVLNLVVPAMRPSPITVSRLNVDFGRVPLYGSETREIVVRNDGSGPLRARFLVRGSTYSVDPRELLLEPGIERPITVMARPDRPGRVNDVLRIQVVGGSVAAVIIPLAVEAADDVIEYDPGVELNHV